WTRWGFLRALNAAFAVGGAFTFDDGPELGAMALHPPGTWPLSWIAELRATPLPLSLPPWRLLTVGRHAERLMHELHPREAHLYLHVVGVHPSQKGRGLGGALLRQAAMIADAAGVPSHLETSNPDNLGLYRRFGYEVKQEITSHGGAPIWTMTTEGPRSSR